ncbi:MAG: precorrin-2 C(20)-methyltransferase [Dongiaceae bacterium]
MAQDHITPGKLTGLGVGPGDPELVTMKAIRLLREAQVVAYPAAKRKPSNARGVVQSYLRDDHIEVPMVYPVTTEKLEPPFDYEAIIRDFYDEMAEILAGHLDAGRDVAVLCEGDPFFYGSFMYIFNRLSGRYQTEVVPGVCSIVASATSLGVPLVYRNQMLSVISGVLSEEELTQRLSTVEAAAIMKLGTNFAKVKRVLEKLGLAERACYIERATMQNQRIVPFAEVEAETVPYFSMILLPGNWQDQ